MSELLAYIPLLRPLNFAHEWWYLLVLPLCFGLSMIYKAMRVGNLDRFWREVATMTLQIILGLIALAIALQILVQVILPALPAE